MSVMLLRISFTFTSCAWLRAKRCRGINAVILMICREEWTDCGRRETMEETGLVLKNMKFSTVVNGVDLPARYHYVELFVQGEVDTEVKAEPINMEPDKCQGMILHICSFWWICTKPRPAFVTFRFVCETNQLHWRVTSLSTSALSLDATQQAFDEPFSFQSSKFLKC